MKLIALILILASVSQAETISLYRLTSNTETRVKVAVIDTGIKNLPEIKPFLCNSTHYDVTNTGIEDTHGHGTNIAGIIAKRIDPTKTCILIIKYFFDNTSPFNLENELNALRILLKEENVGFANFSSGGPAKMDKERELIREILKKGIYFITAAGNNNADLSNGNCFYYPACYNFLSTFFRVVGNGKNPEHKNPMTNYGMPITDWEDGIKQTGFGITMSGTSQAAAMVTGNLAGKK